VATGCFVSTGRSLEQAIDRVKLAESLGYHSAFVTHIAGRESLTVVTAYALATQRIRVGTGVVPIYTRTPATMVQTAATIDELSAGRLSLGLGISHRPVVEGWHGQTIDHPVAEMREYVQTVRAILRGEDPPSGRKWRTGFRLAGLAPRPELPIFIAALSPAMLRLAGEIGDGVMLWLCNPSYIRDVVVPAMREGRERAGKPIEGFEIVAAVPAAHTDDPAVAYEAIRGELFTYFSLPFYRTMLERSGYAAESPGSTPRRETRRVCAPPSRAGSSTRSPRPATRGRCARESSATSPRARLRAPPAGSHTPGGDRAPRIDP
jgi:alkanesulfonate monooxygenase SsuD/methylene tetrahydromethanopterin reductase-like flavin-dependent oxidoreductase (luciferase family)